jgi:isoleucyl-tRNA synthetase
MPYAQQHYPFEKVGVRSEELGVCAQRTDPVCRASYVERCGSGDLSHFFPADFIAEGLDQTRGWFYTLMVLGTCLFDKSPFKNVVVNGLVLAEDGKKMSKRLKNYPDPMHILEEYGADALRLYMIYSPVVRAENLRFSEAGVKQILRDLLIPWWNAYSFFVTYANVDGFHEAELVKPASTNVLDRWIVSSLETLIHDVTEAMDVYDLQRSVRPFVNFVEDLTNWYIRRSRRRFWKSQNDDDKMHAYRTLRYVLVQLSQVAAPFTPFISETIYRNLKGASMPESVHLCDFPTADAAARDEALERSMALVQAVVKMGRQLRTENDLKVRQPLGTLYIVSTNVEILKAMVGYKDLINDELNVKEIKLDADETKLVEVTVKANFKSLGPKCGANMKRVAAMIEEFSSKQIQELNAGYVVTENGIEITKADVVIKRTPKSGMVVASEGDVIVALETALTPELIWEGLAREFVSRVQNLRKDADFEVTQRIAVTVDCDAEVKTAVTQFEDYVKAETLCESLGFDLVEAAPADLNGHVVKIAVAKA